MCMWVYLDTAAYVKDKTYYHASGYSFPMSLITLHFSSTSHSQTNRVLLYDHSSAIETDIFRSFPDPVKRKLTTMYPYGGCV